MVFLVLPSPVSIPRNNPTASAEYAPVPGRQQQAANANFGQTQQASSAGIGAGGAGQGPVPGQPPVTPPQFDPRQKNCISGRQTEDPLSPPCVPFFDGDNGDRTFPGVTKDEIRIAFLNTLGVAGDMTLPWKPSDEGSRSSTRYESTYIYRTVKAHLRYFQRRYQTYGRAVKVTALSTGGTACSQLQGEATRTKNEVDPFGAVFLYDNGQCYMEKLAKKYQIPSFGLNQDVPRKRYENHRPYVYGFFPDQESEAAWSASFICKKLKGGTARFTSDPLLAGRERKFGFIHPRASGRGPEIVELSELLIKNLESRCGMEFDEFGPYNGGGQQEAAGIISRFKQRGVTTIVCYCIPVQTELTVGTMQNTASGQAYFPEWYWDHASRMFRAIWNRRYGDPRQQSFGVTHHWRNPALEEQHHYQAYLQEEPGTQPNLRFNFDIYHLFLNLFQAIQAAGPDLTPETVERGMFTFNYLERRNPWIAIGGYGPYNENAVSNYTFVDTAMGWWWDPTGTPPGGQVGEGCLRAMNQGLRYYAGEWPSGDADLFTDDAPCYADDTEINDPASF